MFGDFFLNRPGFNFVFLVVLLLDGAAPVRFLDGLPHGRGDLVPVHNHPAVDVSGGPSDHLNEGRGRPQKSTPVGVEDGDQRDLRQVQPLPQQVDPHQDIELPFSKVPEDLDPVQGIHLRVEVLDLEPHRDQVIGQVFGQPLGQGRYQHSPVLFGLLLDLVDQVVDLIVGGLDGNRRIHQTRWTDDLFDHLFANLPFVVRRGGRNVDGLTGLLPELIKLKRPVVVGGRQPESVFNEFVFAGPIAGDHAPDLGNALVTFVDEGHEVVGKVVQQRIGRFAGDPAVQVTGVVFNPVHVADFLKDFQIVLGPGPDPLGFEFLPAGTQFLLPFLQFGPDRLHGPVPLVPGQDEVVGRIDHDALVFLEDFPRQGIDLHDGFDLVTEHFKPQGGLLVGGKNFHHVPASPERPLREIDVVSFVLEDEQSGKEFPSGKFLTDLQGDDLPPVGSRGTQAVDGRDAGHHDNVPAARQRGRGRKSKSIDLVVDRGVLLDVGVGLGHVGFGLIIIVKAHEILDRVVRKKFPKFVVKLRGEGFVMGEDQGRALDLLNHVRHRERLAASGHPEQCLIAKSLLQAPGQRLDRLGLIAGGVKGTPEVKGTLGLFQPLDRTLRKRGSGHDRLGVTPPSELPPGSRVSRPVW